MQRISRKLIRLPRTVLALAFLVAGTFSSLHAQFEVKSGVYNRLSNRVPANNTGRVAPVGPGGTPTGAPTITPQYSNMVESSASAGPISSASGYPASVVAGKGITLNRASVGTTFASGVPRYFFGDEIKPPTVIFDSAGVATTVPASYWRAEPVRAGELLINPSGDPAIDFQSRLPAAIAALPAGTLANYYYSPHAKRVFASTPGAVEITWRSNVPDSTLNPGKSSYVFIKEKFAVSSATNTPVRTIYWTEKSFNGPRITIPDGRITTVNPVYSNVFPDTVPEEYTVVGTSNPTSDPNATAVKILRTFWYEKSNGRGELHAYNRVGRILLEYLGTLREDGTYEFLGADIVNVQQSAASKILTVELGTEIRPEPDENLIATPVSSGPVDQVFYYGSNPRPDGSLAYYAERENDIEDRVAFYWLETDDAAIPANPNAFPGLRINWPKYLNKYLQVWPADVTRFAHYTVASGGSSLDTGTGLKFDGGRIPQIIYQDSANGAEAAIDTDSQRLLVNLSPVGDGQNRTLLKFVGSNGGVWYVPLMTQSENRASFLEGDAAGALTGTAYVGERIPPPSPAYSVAGYVFQGRSYAPGAYIDPFTTSVADAEKGAIIPVNALSGAQNPLTVWWFKKVPAKSAEFPDFYTPAKIGRYSVAYRASDRPILEDFDQGATGWSSNITATLGGGKFLGPYGASGIPVTQKTFLLDGNEGNGATISFLFYRIDTWDTENFKVFINGNTIINQPFSTARVTATLQGSASYGNATYAWMMMPVADGYGSFIGSASVDQAFKVTIKVTPMSGTSVDSLNVGFGSTLNESVADESFGIDDFAIDVPLPQIVMASNQGTGKLPAEIASGTIYNQPDRAKLGYNANEEQAVIIGDRGYAMRDDLNVISGTSFTSLPRVLIQYTNPDDARPSFAVYEVLRENSIFHFSYTVDAATILGSPMPLPLLPLPIDSNGSVRNTEVNPGANYSDPPPSTSAPGSYTPFTFKDRKGYDWVARGPHAGGNPSLGMQFYYTMRPEFYFPDRAIQPAVGTILPYLRLKNSDGTFAGDPVSGTPLTVLYYPAWPTNPSTLSVGETLALSKHGLPAVRGQTSARVLYQQSIAVTGTASVILHDPTRAKSVLLNDTRVGLAKLPVSLKTTSQNGKTYFQLAQPHLQQRFYFNPLLGNLGGLELIGQFIDEVAGEDYVNLNTLSPDDTAALKGLVDDADAEKTQWYAAIDALSTTIETFKENPAKRGTYIVDSTKNAVAGSQTLPEVLYSDTAVDSYALTAPGKASGYVTLLFGDGEAFTPQGEPVSMQVIKVVPQLYKGDLKKLSASNPLDEQTTLRHSGDFAAHPEYYEYEWRYALPTGGIAPPTYNNGYERTLGTTSTNTWYKLANQTATPPSTLTYPIAAIPLPSSIQINNAAYVAGSSAPGQILKSIPGISFIGAVPSQVIFSANLGSNDGFVLYVNGSPALAYQLPFGANLPANLTAQAPRSGLAGDGLGFQFELDRSLFNVGTNQIEVALYSSEGANSSNSAIEFRINTSLQTDLVAAIGSPWQTTSNSLSNIVVVGGSAGSPLGNPLLLFGDNYFTMRYRAKESAALITGTTWSPWMEPVLVESWVKRVLAGINPFNQRQTDLYNNPVSTDVSVLTQAGKRWEGDVALNLKNINDFGLIEIYETVLNRVKKQSIDAGVTTDAVNNTLLLAAGYLNDLYMTLGNEAWDDAQNPTIQIDAQAGADQISSARFSFEGQMASLMDETLALLRGRDDFLSPGTRTTPAYNRLYWNYTRGINSGEPIYAVNYNIKEKSQGGTNNGKIDAADAQVLFPQGHGDAYGHYLTALTGYYKLLTSPVFTWTPSTEAVTVLGQTVQVDYKDERKFAAAAAALARTGVDVLDFTARENHQEGEIYGWGNKHDGKNNSQTGRTRAWGTDEWSSRVSQGAYYNWVSANAMLPDVDTQHEGIQKIDRSTVPEINELVASANKVIALSAGEQAHLNPLGLAADAMAFDISPSELAAGQSHFEQIYGRAVKAAVNAKNAFTQAGKMNQLLRQQNNSLDEYNQAVIKQENAYEYQLTELFGTPYAGDVGPGKLYAQGYSGPDLYHSYFIDRPSALIATGTAVTMNFREPINTNPSTDWSLDTVRNKLADPAQYVNRTFTISPFELGQFSDTVTAGLGRRAQTGQVQSALLDCYEAQVNVRESADNLSKLMQRFERDYQLYSEFITAHEAADASSAADSARAMEKARAALTKLRGAAYTAAVGEFAETIAGAAAEGLPTEVGLANDVTSVPRSIILIAGNIAGFALKLGGVEQEAQAASLQLDAETIQGDADGALASTAYEAAQKEHIVEFERLYDEVRGTAYEITRRLTQLQRATQRVSNLYAAAGHILSERETFRWRAATIVQGYRTRDVVYRAFRNEELSQYKGLFDLAQTYTYCATKAYDYETGLLDSPVGWRYVNKIIGTYSVGAWDGLNPVAATTGDSGLASVLSGLRDDWAVAKGRLGINNPDSNGTLFSLRQELFRIRTDQATADDNLLWKQVLQQHIMTNVLNDPDVAIYCNNIRKADGTAVPGIVIPFSTTIEQGLNYFGWPLASGDHTFSQSTFATKIFSSGLVFQGYVGMDPFSIGTPGAGGPASSNANALGATPYAYLIPAGADTMRAPAFGDTNVIRTWSIKDQAIPLPRNLGATSFSANQFFTPEGSLNEKLWITRKHQAFRAVDDQAYFYSSMPAEFTNSRLIGRSVWNSQWKIVIPAYSLLNDEQSGLDRFTKSVNDIKLFLRTYSNSGN